MIVRAILPHWPNRTVAGQFGIWDEIVSGKWILGPFPCLGKADNGKASEHKNPTRDPKLPFGDHPTGVYVIAAIQEMPLPSAVFGPWRLVIQPVRGDCVDRENAEPGDDGIMAHGGKRGGPYTHQLRPTNGCLRVYDEDITVVALYARDNGLKTYECVEQ